MPDLNEVERIQLQEQRRQWLTESRDKARVSAASARQARERKRAKCPKCYDFIKSPYFFCAHCERSYQVSEVFWSEE